MQVKIAGSEKTKNVHGPWKMAGEQLMILAVAQDGDVKESGGYFHSSPTLKGKGFFHQEASQWPRYVLEAKK